MKDARRDLFVLDQSVLVSASTVRLRRSYLTYLKRRPGVLVLVNDADWELDGGETYELQDRDSILFVSTLHGG